MRGFSAHHPHNKWQTTQNGVWTGGFWAGLLWLEFEQSKSAATRTRAMAFTERLLPRAQDTRNHDLGFMFFPSAIKGWELTGDARYHASAIAAARSLAAQFNDAGGFMCVRLEWLGIDRYVDEPAVASVDRAANG